MLLILKLMQRSDPDFSERGPGSESGEDEESDPYHCLQGVTCEECGLECRSKNALSKHIRTHQKLDCSVSISSFIYLCVSIYFSGSTLSLSLRFFPSYFHLSICSLSVSFSVCVSRYIIFFRFVVWPSPPRASLPVMYARARRSPVQRCARFVANPTEILNSTTIRLVGILYVQDVLTNFI